jgi:hypothetical protein
MLQHVALFFKLYQTADNVLLLSDKCGFFHV